MNVTLQISIKATSDIMLSEIEEKTRKNKQIAKNKQTFNDRFGSILNKLGLDHWEDKSLVSD